MHICKYVKSIGNQVVRENKNKIIIGKEASICLMDKSYDNVGEGTEKETLSMVLYKLA